MLTYSSILRKKLNTFHNGSWPINCLNLSMSQMRQNIKKSIFSIFCPKSDRQSLQINETKLQSGSITRSGSVKYLGVIIDEELSWKHHVDYVCNKIKKFC